MPLEVRQIGIRFSVEDAPDDDEDDGAPQPGDGSVSLDGDERRMIVEQCVRAVLEELKRAGER